MFRLIKCFLKFFMGVIPQLVLVQKYGHLHFNVLTI